MKTQTLIEIGYVAGMLGMFFLATFAYGIFLPESCGSGNCLASSGFWLCGGIGFESLALLMLTDHLTDP